MDWIRNNGAHWVSIGDYLQSLGIEAACLPRSVRIVLEAALVGSSRGQVQLAECETIARWLPGTAGAAEWRFPVARVLMQDASGLPLLADLAALRDEVAMRGLDPAGVDLALPATLVIDHSVIANHWGRADALDLNMDAEFAANAERYAFARWAEQAFASLQLVPPGNGIVHQVHLESVAELVVRRDDWILCDSVIGTDSHSTMVNGLGILGWGVGGIEAEASLLGQPLSIASPEIIGVELTGAPGPGVFGADLALALTAHLRREGVVSAFVEFFGEGIAGLDVPDRTTIANMAPEYGATLALFPVDEDVLAYLRQFGRSEQLVDRARKHLINQGLFGAAGEGIAYDRVICFDLGVVEPVLSGPSLPHEPVPLARVPQCFAEAFDGQAIDGRVVLAAITSCTNTANMRSLVAAGLLARNAVEQGLHPPRHVKTVFAPGSRSASATLAELGLLAPLEALGFHVAAYGCGPCVGNSGDLADGIEAELAAGGVAAAVLSGNRNFEGRIHRAIRSAWLGSPMLVVAYSLAGRIDADIGALLSRLAPSDAEVADVLGQRTEAGPSGWHMSQQWEAIPQAKGHRFTWPENSSFFVRPPFFNESRAQALCGMSDGRPLLVLGDSVTTDHISPVGAIGQNSESAAYLSSLGVTNDALGSYAARRVNHEVMLRGTFANPRLRNRLVETAGPVTRTMPGNKAMPVHWAAAHYRDAGQATVILAGHNYGAGSARDWAAKGTALLGVRAVLARSFERIHRSNLVALGILPIAVEGELDPWRFITPSSDVVIAFDIDPAVAKPNLPLTVHCSVDGVSADLPARLMVATASEITQLKEGTLFAMCLDEMLLQMQPTATAESQAKDHFHA